jgi:integrase
VSGALSRVRASKAGKATKLAFELLVLTATRSAEAREATWSEIDLEKREWVIPASRMKAKRLHRIPLSDRAVAILREALPLKQEQGDLVFPGTKAGKPLSDMTLSKLMKELGIAAVPHGFRSSFRDWAGEATNHPQQVCEFALAHVIADKSEAAYARSDLLEKRRLLMDDWSAYLATTVPKSSSKTTA